jgi:hypothetical protein
MTAFQAGHSSGMTPFHPSATFGAYLKKSATAKHLDRIANNSKSRETLPQKSSIPLWRSPFSTLLGRSALQREPPFLSSSNGRPGAQSRALRGDTLSSGSIDDRPKLRRAYFKAIKQVKAGFVEVLAAATALP